MAQYKAHPHYAIKVGDQTITFDYFGAYETDNQDEIAALDALCPTWLKRVDEPKPENADEPEPKTEEPEAPVKPTRKSSGK